MKVRYMMNGTVVAKDIPADRVSLMGNTLVFSKTTSPPSASENILLAIPESKLLDAEEVQA